VRLARECARDPVLPDYVMPVKSGLATCRELREIPKLADVPIIELTAFGRRIVETHGREEGLPTLELSDCLEKPVEPNVLLDRIATALAQTS